MFSKTNKFSKIENQLEDVRSDVRKNLRLFEGIVITSYSIHYTKLYETGRTKKSKTPQHPKFNKMEAINIQ